MADEGVTVEVEVRGLRGLRRAFDKKRAKTTAGRMRKLLMEVSKPIVPQAKAEAPVAEIRKKRDEGQKHLRDSISRRSRRGTGRGDTLAQVTIGVPKRDRRNVSVGIWQEHGTTRMEPNPFLSVAWDRNVDAMERQIKSRLQRVIDDNEGEG